MSPYKYDCGTTFKALIYVNEGESSCDCPAARALQICYHALTIISMEKTAETPIIADTSVLGSLATDTDHNHKPATEAAAKLYEVARPSILL